MEKVQRIAKQTNGESKYNELQNQRIAKDKIRKPLKIRLYL